MISWPSKDPQEVADYSWRPQLDDGDAISSFTATTDSDITIDSQSIGNGLATIWLSGGNAGDTATFTLVSTTTAGRTFKETARIAIVDSSALGDFHLLFPQFKDVDARLIELRLTEGAQEVANWPEQHQPRAAMLYAAHKLTEGGQARVPSRWAFPVSRAARSLPLSPTRRHHAPAFPPPSMAVNISNSPAVTTEARASLGRPVFEATFARIAKGFSGTYGGPFKEGVATWPERQPMTMAGPS